MVLTGSKSKEDKQSNSAMAGCKATCSWTGEEVLADVADHGERPGNRVIGSENPQTGIHNSQPFLSLGLVE
jgi:hypothetical protein